MSKRIQKFRQMRRAIQAQPSSGLSIASYCLKHKIHLSTFGWWKKRIREGEASLSRIARAENNPGFVRILPDAQTLACRENCELSFPDGRVLSFPISYPLESLLTVLKGVTV